MNTYNFNCITFLNLSQGSLRPELGDIMHLSQSGLRWALALAEWGTFSKVGVSLVILVDL